MGPKFGRNWRSRLKWPLRQPVQQPQRRDIRMGGRHPIRIIAPATLMITLLTGMATRTIRITGILITMGMGILITLITPGGSARIIPLDASGRIIAGFTAMAILVTFTTITSTETISTALRTLGLQIMRAL